MRSRFIAPGFGARDTASVPFCFSLKSAGLNEEELCVSRILL
jgi:hypothetical protein